MGNGIVIVLFCFLAVIADAAPSTGGNASAVTYKVTSSLVKQASFGHINSSLERPVVVAYMPPATEFNFYLDIGKGVNAVASATGNDAFMFAPQSDIPSEQLKMLRDVIRRKVDAIIVSTHDPVAAAPLLEKAVSEGIVVVVINSDTPEFPTPVHAVVGYGQRLGTEKMGRYLLNLVGEQARMKVGVIEGAPGYHSTERVEGFLESIKNANFDVVSRINGKWNTEGGNAAALAMFTDHPDIEVVFAANDFEIIGAASALETLGIHDVVLLGNDGDPAVLERIAKGEITATVNTNPIMMGKIGMKVALDSVSKKFKGGFVETPTVIVDKANVNAYWQAPKPLEGDNNKRINIVSEAFPGLVDSDRTGLYMDILREIYLPQGIKLDVSIVPHARGIEMVKNKKADVLLGASRSELENGIFPQWNYSVNTISVIYKKDRWPEWKAQDSLKNKKVGWIRRYGYDKYLYVPIKQFEHTNRRSLLLMLEKGRLDYVMDNGFNLLKELSLSREYLQKNGFDESDFAIEDLMTLKVYMAFSQTEKAARFAKIFDDEFAQLLASGRLKVLFDKWNYTPYPFK